MSTQDINKFIPDKLRSRELYSKVESVLQELTDEQLEFFNDVVLKYKDPFSIDRQGAIEVVEELGYGYITEIFTALTEEELNATSAEKFNKECPWLWPGPSSSPSTGGMQLDDTEADNSNIEAD